MAITEFFLFAIMLGVFGSWLQLQKNGRLLKEIADKV